MVAVSRSSFFSSGEPESCEWEILVANLEMERSDRWEKEGQGEEGWARGGVKDVLFEG